jgi:hypothetical protein
VQKKRVRRSGYTDELKYEARQLYEVDGLTPSAIQGQLEKKIKGSIPIDTIKSWVRGLVRGSGKSGESHAPWDFSKATPEERLLVAPVFTFFKENGFKTAPEAWPSQGVADWVVRLRQLRDQPDFSDLHRTARYLAMLDRRIADETASAEDKVSRNAILALRMERAGWPTYREEQEWVEEMVLAEDEARAAEEDDDAE